MKKILFGGLCVLLFTMSFVSVLGFRAWQVKKEVAPATPSFTPSPIDFKLEAPRQSLSGEVVRVVGDVRKTIRDEKDPQQATVGAIVLEGEQLTASPSGSADVRFAQSDLFSISPETILAFPSTNPSNFLVKLDKGTVVYQTDEQIATISARSLHALLSLSQGKAFLSVDPDKKLIVFMIAEGQGEIGYIDSDNKTQTLKVAESKSVSFDDTKRTVKVK